MFYELKDDEEKRMFEEYWREEKEANSPLWRKIAPKQAADGRWFVVRTFRSVDDAPAPSGPAKVFGQHGRPSRPLPYNLVETTTACDLWSVGALAYLLLAREPLVPVNSDDDCVNGDAMATICCCDDETIRQRLEKIDDLAARDLLSHLLVADPEQRLGYSLGDALEHVFFDPANTEKQRELEKANVLDRINARPPKPFQLQDFERLCENSSETKSHLEAAIFEMLDSYALARPCDTRTSTRKRAGTR